MKLTNKEIKDILISQSYLEADDFKEADKKCEKKEGALASCLLTNGIISKDLLGQALAEWYKIPYADLNSNQPSRDQVLKIKRDTAMKYRVVLFSDDGKNAVVTTDNPKQKDLTAVLKSALPKRKITIAFSVPEDIDETFVHYRKTLNTKFSGIIKENRKFAPEIIDSIIDDASTYRASDIHFEPQGENVLIRFRIDGVLQEAGRVEYQYYENILNRIKVQAQLRIDEHNNAQDGAIRFVTNSGISVDLRISIIPTLDGEKVVIRLLSEYVQGLSLGDLGFDAKEESTLEKHISKPFGMILSVGPTGSGKTTTLYTLLKRLNKPNVNVTTIEDPVEYKVQGINQIQVNNQTGLTFAKGLRSIVRQDPNVILIGEIRDADTAEIAVNAALTGHLVLSTFHANDASTAIPRLIDMGVEPFLLSSTIEVIVAQRLARKLCERCRYSVSGSDSYVKNFHKDVSKYFTGNKKTVFRAKGCDSCNNTGYKGRVGLFELISATPEFKDLILKNPSAQQIWDLYFKKGGARTLFEDGLDKVSKGLTSLEEVMRVAPPLD